MFFLSIVYVALLQLIFAGATVKPPVQRNYVLLDDERKDVIRFIYEFRNTKVRQDLESLPHKFTTNPPFNGKKNCKVKLPLESLQFEYMSNLTLCLFKDHWEEDVVLKMMIEMQGNNEIMEDYKFMKTVTPVTGYVLNQRASLVSGYIINSNFYGQVRLYDQFLTSFIVYYLEPLNNLPLYNGSITMEEINTRVSNEMPDANAAIFEYLINPPKKRRSITKRKKHVDPEERKGKKKERVIKRKKHPPKTTMPPEPTSTTAPTTTTASTPPPPVVHSTTIKGIKRTAATHPPLIRPTTEILIIKDKPNSTPQTVVHSTVPPKDIQRITSARIPQLVHSSSQPTRKPQQQRQQQPIIVHSSTPEPMALPEKTTKAFIISTPLPDKPTRIFLFSSPLPSRKVKVTTQEPKTVTTTSSITTTRIPIVHLTTEKQIETTTSPTPLVYSSTQPTRKPQQKLPPSIVYSSTGKPIPTAETTKPFLVSTIGPNGQKNKFVLSTPEPAREITRKEPTTTTSPPVIILTTMKEIRRTTTSTPTPLIHHTSPPPTEQVEKSKQPSIVHSTTLEPVERDIGKTEAVFISTPVPEDDSERGRKWYLKKFLFSSPLPAHGVLREKPTTTASPSVVHSTTVQETPRIAVTDKPVVHSTTEKETRTATKPQVVLHLTTEEGTRAPAASTSIPLPLVHSSTHEPEKVKKKLKSIVHSTTAAPVERGSKVTFIISTEEPDHGEKMLFPSTPAPLREITRKEPTTEASPPVIKLTTKKAIPRTTTSTPTPLVHHTSPPPTEPVEKSVEPSIVHSTTLPPVERDIGKTEALFISTPEPEEDIGSERGRKWYIRKFLYSSLPPAHVATRKKPSTTESAIYLTTMKQISKTTSAPPPLVHSSPQPTGQFKKRKKPSIIHATTGKPVERKATNKILLGSTPAPDLALRLYSSTVVPSDGRRKPRKAILQPPLTLYRSINAKTEKERTKRDDFVPELTNGPLIASTEVPGVGLEPYSSTVSPDVTVRSFTSTAVPSEGHRKPRRAFSRAPPTHFRSTDDTIEKESTNVNDFLPEVPKDVRDQFLEAPRAAVEKRRRRHRRNVERKSKRFSDLMDELDDATTEQSEVEVDEGLDEYYDMVEEVMFQNGKKEERAEIFDYTRDGALVCKLCLWLQPSFAHKFGFQLGAHYGAAEIVDLVRYMNWIFRPMDFNIDYKPENIGFAVRRLIVSTIPEIESIPLEEWQEDGRQFVPMIAKVLTAKFSGNEPCCAILGFVDINMPPFGSLSYRRSMCVKNKNFALISGRLGDNKVAKYDIYRDMMHAIGHLMGALNDDDGDPDCYTETDNEYNSPYIMDPVHQLNIGVRPNSMRMSFCSRIKISVFLDSSHTNCLETLPSAYCGNGIVEPGEECDCGSPWQCLAATEECCGLKDSFFPCKEFRHLAKRRCKEPEVMEHDDTET